MSYTSVKRRFTTGSTVRVTNTRFPHLNGVRTVVKHQTNGLYTGPARQLDGSEIPKVWASWPKANEVRVDESGPAPKVEFLDTATAEVAFTYELLEQA